MCRADCALAEVSTSTSTPSTYEKHTDKRIVMLCVRNECVVKSEVDALAVITISRGCFERCCSNKKTPPCYHSVLSFVTLRNRRADAAPCARIPYAVRG